MAQKKPRKKQPAKRPQPQAAQLKAVERLLAEEKYEQAVTKVRPLLRQFPDHHLLNSFLIEALEHTAGPSAAGLAAFEWTRRKPNSVPAQEALFHFTLNLGHLMLADRTARRLAELGVETEGFPLPEEIKQQLLGAPDGTRVSGDEMELFDIGKLHLEARDFDGVLRWLEGVSLISARNNRALALFHLGRTVDALAAFLESWQADPDNLYALGWALQLRLYLGDESGAKGLATPLRSASARRSEDGVGQLNGLLLLREDQPAWEIFEGAQASDWDSGEISPTDAQWNHLGACAACRLGDERAARQLWQKALEIHPNQQSVLRNLETLRTSRAAFTTPEGFETSQLLPIGWIDALRAGVRDLSGPLDALDASDLYLNAAFFSGNEVTRKLIVLVLKRRAKLGDREAVDILRELARLPIGTREERFRLLSFLREEALVAPDEEFELWDGSEMRSVKTYGTEIHREPADSGLPSELAVVLEESVQLQMEGKFQEAEHLLEQILDQFPDHPVALGNMAVIRSSRGKKEEAKQLLWQTIERNPDYLYARCNLARILTLEGEIEEADSLLHGLMERERMHIFDAIAYYGALALLHRAKGEDDAAQRLLQSIEHMAEEEEEKLRYTAVRQMVQGYRRPGIS